MLGNQVFDEEELKRDLGDKYYELGDMVNNLKSNLKKVAEQSKQAQPLQLRIQHAYTYSKWDSIHDPYNVVENILRDDDTVYKALTPNLDFTLLQGQLCYMAEITIFPGDCGPEDVEVSFSLTKDIRFKCPRQVAVRQELQVPRVRPLQTSHSWRARVQIYANPVSKQRTRRQSMLCAICHRQGFG